jgi:hypothetical protein
LQYNQKAYEIIINNENDSLNRVNLLKLLIGFITLMIGGFKKTVYLVLEKSENTNDSLEHCERLLISEIIMFHNPPIVLLCFMIKLKSI